MSKAFGCDKCELIIEGWPTTGFHKWSRIGNLGAIEVLVAFGITGIDKADPPDLCRECFIDLLEQQLEAFKKGG